MKAIRIHQKGGPEVLIYQDAPRPRLMPGDALVRVCASAITKDELTWDPTYQTANGEPRTPSIPGHEFSGVVEELATETEVAKVGDDVIAERLDVLARERLVLRRRARRRARAEPWSRVVLQVEGGVDQVVALVGEVRRVAGCCDR